MTAERRYLLGSVPGEEGAGGDELRPPAVGAGGDLDELLVGAPRARTIATSFRRTRGARDRAEATRLRPLDGLEFAACLRVPAHVEQGLGVQLARGRQGRGGDDVLVGPRLAIGGFPQFSQTVVAPAPGECRPTFRGLLLDDSVAIRFRRGTVR